MLKILRTALTTGRVTAGYPREPSQPPAAFRGRPVYQAGVCQCDGSCAAVCPTQAITAGPGARWALDMARCVFCGLCEEACPSQAISFSSDFELARTHRDALVVRASAPVPSPPPLPTPDTHALAGKFSRCVRSLLRRSLHIRHMDAGSDNSTDWELSALLNPVYDIQRLGIDVVASPRHADVLFVTGAVTRNLALALQRTYDAMPVPALVVAAGAEACGGGVLQGGYATAGGVDQCLPVDVYIPGDPPRPEAIIYGLLLAMQPVRR